MAGNETTDSNSSIPSPNKRNDEVRTRINVGWLTTEVDAVDGLDTSIVEYSTRLGQSMYNFVAHPIGGVVRAFWEYTSGVEPPKINLPDMQLQNHLWETYISGQISPWIDCDSEDENLRKISEDELLKEFNYVCYLGLRSVIVFLKHVSSPRLAAFINKWLWTKHANFTIWVVVPTAIDKLQMGVGENVADVWSVWADFRKLCANYTSIRLHVGIHVTSELDSEFSDSRLLARWKAEPIGAVIVDTDVFITDPREGVAVLPASHNLLVRSLWMSDNVRSLIRQTLNEGKFDASKRSEYAAAIRNTVKDVAWLRRKEDSQVGGGGYLQDSNIDFCDVLQAPLQPLADNLDSGVYNTFEQDPIKYKKYRDAVEAALYDIGESAKRPRDVVVYMLGAGRGPIVTACFEAEHAYNDRYRTKKDKLNMNMIVVEKNPNAIVTLRFMNERGWRNRATLVESDMRSLPAKALELGLERPDIIVSELLGSFGDNELSPECLDGVTPFLKPTTISIPQKYTSYAAPVMSLNMHQTILSSRQSYWNHGITGPGRRAPDQIEDGSYINTFPQGQTVANLDQIYVVFLRQFCSLAPPQPVFSFEHPNFDNSTNERSTVVEFDIDRPADIMGFAGYFDMVLYKDVMLSIHPQTHSRGMISWFPALIPLRSLHRVSEGDKVRLLIERKIDNAGVWYEWCIEHQQADGRIVRTVVQNEGGESYYMRQ